MKSPADERIIRDLISEIENSFNRLGLLFRVFGRVKSEKSLQAKIENNPGKYGVGGKKIQDLFGLRVAVYFNDDITIAESILKNLYSYDHASSTVDNQDDKVFSASRHNLIFRLPADKAADSYVLSANSLIDNTFEVQIRTVLSEGWHEVEHDLRYKCQSDWAGSSDMSRALNGIYASLETSDWGMLSIFNELAYRAYKKSDWESMLRNKFRLRFDGTLSESIVKILDEDKVIAKEIFRTKRSSFIEMLADSKIRIPVTMDNWVFLLNLHYLKHQKIKEITPNIIIDEYSDSGLTV